MRATGAPGAPGATHRPDPVTVAYEKLSPADKAKYDEVLRALKRNSHRDYDARGEIEALQKLLVEGKLTQPSSLPSGTTALDQMARLSREGAKILHPGNFPLGSTIFKAEGLNPTQLALATLVNQLANPGLIDQGQGTVTCGATSVQRMLAESNPGEYARLAVGLLVDGEVRTKDGHSMKADPSGLKETSDLRSAVSELMQDSFMSLARSLAPDGSVGALSPDQMGAGTYPPRTGGKFGSGEGKNGGLTANQVVGLYDAVFRQSSVPVGVSGMSDMQRISALQDATRNGPVMVGVDVVRPDTGQHGGHVIVVQNVDLKKGVATIYDPGSGETSEVSLRQLVGDLRFVMGAESSAGKTKQAPATVDGLNSGGIYTKGKNKAGGGG